MKKKFPNKKVRSKTFLPYSLNTVMMFYYPSCYNPRFQICSKSSKNDPESAILHNTSDLISSIKLHNTPHGIFNNKYPLHLIPHPTKQNVFTNRISYNTYNDSYYENGIVDKKYIEFWDEGTLYNENLVYVADYSYDGENIKDIIALYPNYDSNLSKSLIIYKFDYSPYENLRISSLAAKLSCFDNYKDDLWIISISTDLSTCFCYNCLNNFKWKVIKESKFSSKDEKANYYKKISNPLNLTQYVKDKKTFYIKIEINLNRFSYYSDIQLFPQTKQNYNKLDDFGFDINVELSPLCRNDLMKSSNFNIDHKNILNIKEDADKNNLSLGGLFNDKYRLNVIPSDEKEDVYVHRISYNTFTDAYYENGVNDIKYLKKWNRGTFAHENLYYSPAFNLRDEVLSRHLKHDNKCNPAYITWKFDYRPGNYYLTSLKLRMKFHLWLHTSKIQWSIQTLPTRKNPNPEFKPFEFPLKKRIFKMYDYQISDFTIDLTEMVKDENGFILKVYLETYGQVQLFRQDINRDLMMPFICEDDFSMDVKVELKPNMMICDLSKIHLNDENFKFNDKNTSDFIIKLEIPKENDGKNIEKIFYVHSKILASKSDYFQALLNSRMLESQNNYLKLSEISYSIFEKLLLFIYTDNFESINIIDVDDYIDLLYVASRFLVPKLVQICELSIRKFVDSDNVEQFEMIAHECGAIQLAKYCEMFEINNDNENENGVKIEQNEYKKKSIKFTNIIKKFKNIFTTFA